MRSRRGSGKRDSTLLDVRTLGEYDGSAGYPCDARQGHIPGARHVDLHDLLAVGDTAEIRALLGLPEGAEVIAYCHSGGRSAIAAEVLAAAGYASRNYVGSWHEWSADGSLPVDARVSRPRSPGTRLQSARPCSFQAPRNASVSARVVARSGISGAPSTNQ